MLPLVAVLASVVFCYVFSISVWLDERIHVLHQDAFTIKYSENGLLLAETLLPNLLVLSLLLFLFFKKQIEQDKRWPAVRYYCLAVSLATISLALRLWQCPMAQDDSYIDYGYVLRWLAGQFDYNPGEHVMGFTSHLHLFILWFVCSILGNQAVDMVSYYVNCAVDTINTLFLFFFILKVYKRSAPAYFAALCFAVSTYNCSQVISGKETALVNLTILITLFCLHTGRLAFLPWCANALFLFRPEGFLSCAIILATHYKIKGKAALKYFIVPCAITCAWYLFLLIYFGSILPHGMIAKHKTLIAGDFFSVFMGCWAAVGNLFTNSSIYLLIPGMERWPFFPTTAAIFIYAFLRFKQPCWALYRNMAAAQLLFLMMAQSRVFSWYYSWFALLIPIVFAQLISEAWPVTKSEKQVALNIMRTVVCLCIFVYLRTGFYFAPFAWLPYLERGVVYREAALYLQEKTQGKELIAASDIGILGYFYHGPVLDLMGLVSDKPLAFYPIRDKAGVAYTGMEYLIPPKAIAYFKPKYLMAPMGHCQGSLMDDDDFMEHYTEIKRWSNPAMTDGIVCIWMRND